MPATFIRTCPLCGLRFSNTPLLELHIREDHPRRDHRPAQDDDNPAGDRGVKKSPHELHTASMPPATKPPVMNETETPEA